MIRVSIIGEFDNRGSTLCSYYIVVISPTDNMIEMHQN